MNKINCNANNCSHNSNGVCYANRINVGGQGATDGIPRRGRKRGERFYRACFQYHRFAQKKRIDGGRSPDGG